jgi:Xaa-Pro aminopeptidase
MMTDHTERRARVLAAITPGVLVVPAAPVAIRNNDVEHEYRQDSDLYYLSGFDEPESVLVLVAGAEHPFTLFVRERNPERETWDGPRAGVEGAASRFGASQAFPIGALAEKLPELLQGQSRLFYRIGRDRAFDDKLLAALDAARAKARTGSTYPTEIIDPARVLHEMRRIKGEGEIAALVRSVGVTREAHLAAMRAAHPGMHEYELEAILRAEFRRHGAERPAYSPIVGSGPNATILHYHRNDRRMVDGDLVLIDAGSEVDYYAADVTRTFPVSGRFTDAQRSVYETVLKAQVESIGIAAPGRTLDEVHRASVGVITEALVRFGVIAGPVPEAIEAERYKPYFMHKTSHYLGMDVHDVGAYFTEGQHRPLDEGVVITVEPGLYFSMTDPAVPDDLKGIGIRIEDDVLVTASGARVLSEDIPRSIDEIERVCAG